MDFTNAFKQGSQKGGHHGKGMWGNVSDDFGVRYDKVKFYGKESQQLAGSKGMSDDGIQRFLRKVGISWQPPNWRSTLLNPFYGN